MVFPWVAAALLGSTAINAYSGNRASQKAWDRRLTGKQRGKEQNEYFDEISPNSTEFERLGVPGITGAQIGADAQRANQKAQVQAQTAQSIMQIASQMAITKENNKTAKSIADAKNQNEMTIATMFQGGNAPDGLQNGAKAYALEGKFSYKNQNEGNEAFTTLSQANRNKAVKEVELIAAQIKNINEKTRTEVTQQLLNVASKGLTNERKLTEDQINDIYYVAKLAGVTLSALGALFFSSKSKVLKAFGNKIIRLGKRKKTTTPEKFGNTKINGKNYKYSFETGEIIGY